MKIVGHIIKSMRIKQWTKNFFIFMPLIFGGKLFDLNKLLIMVYAFFIHSVASSGIYLLNDIIDKKTDKFHPKKQKRPIALGDLSVRLAIAVSSLLIVSSLIASYILVPVFSLMLLLYVVLHIFYSFKLKKLVILDVITIALGFELRIWSGSVVSQIPPSIWLQLCVFLLAIFLGLIKRRHEKTSLYAKADQHRNVLSHYKIYFIDQMTTISAALCIVFYGLYSVSPDITSRIGSTKMAYTIPFVIYGIFRYLYVVHTKNVGGDPGEILLTDIPLIIDITLWIITSIFLVYVAMT